MEHSRERRQAVLVVKMNEEQQESVVDPIVYVRQHRTKGNRYHLVIASLLSG